MYLRVLWLGSTLLFFFLAGRTAVGLTAADYAQSCWHILTCSAHTNSVVNLQADKAPELGKREKAPALSQSARAGLQVCFNSSSVWSVCAEQTGPSGSTDLFYTFTNSTVSSLPSLLFVYRSSL